MLIPMRLCTRDNFVPAQSKAADAPVARAFGACGPRVSILPSKFADNWRLEHRFKPAMSQATRERKLKGWARAVKGVLASDEGEG
jgi:hypothetical protein